jgi:hypothetical protein
LSKNIYFKGIIYFILFLYGYMGMIFKYLENTCGSMRVYYICNHWVADTPLPKKWGPGTKADSAGCEQKNLEKF